MRTILLGVALCLAAGPAGADQQAASACAAGLGKDPRAIYDASVAAVGADTDLKALLTEKTRGLARADQIERDTARASARAAMKCLALKQDAD